MQLCLLREQASAKGVHTPGTFNFSRGVLAYSSSVCCRLVDDLTQCLASASVKLGICSSSDAVEGRACMICGYTVTLSTATQQSKGRTVEIFCKSPRAFY